MGLEYIYIGDTTAAVIDILNNAPEVTALNPVKISSNMTGYNAGDRWIVITQQGGSFQWPYPAHPRIDIECLAESRTVAYQMISTCISVMFREQGTYSGNGVRICAAQIETSPFQSSEKFTDRVRYLTALRLIVRPA